MIVVEKKVIKYMKLPGFLLWVLDLQVQLILALLFQAYDLNSFDLLLVSSSSLLLLVYHKVMRSDSLILIVYDILTCICQSVYKYSFTISCFKVLRETSLSYSKYYIVDSLENQKKKKINKKYKKHIVTSNNGR